MKTSRYVRAVNRLSSGLLVGLSFAALVLALPRPARAAGAAAEAEALIRQGLQLRAQNKPGRALPIFEKAYQISPNARTAAHMGLVQLELGYFVEAERYLTEALAAPDHPWIANNKAKLERQLNEAKGNIGELAVAGSPDGAEIWVNGKRAGQLPMAAPLRLDKGRAEVQVRSPGYLPATDLVTISRGKREERTYALARDPAAPPPPVAEAPRTTGLALGGAASEPALPVTGTAAATLEATPAPPANPRRALRLSAWIVGGVSLAALAFGTYEAFEVASARDAFNNHMGTVGGVYGRDCGTGSLSPECKPLKDAYDQAVALSIVGFASAGALAAGAAVLFLLSSPGRDGVAEPAASARAFACLPDPSGRGLACNLRF